MRSGCWRRSSGLHGGREKRNRSPSCAGRWDLARRVEREAVFHPEFREDLRYWVKTDRKAALRTLELVDAAVEDPFTGIGKPEPLKFVLAGCCSRRITQGHTLGYRGSGKGSGFFPARYPPPRA